MKKRQSSITAEGVAFARAMESSKPAGERICYDPVARHLISPLLFMLFKVFYGYKQRRSPGVAEFLVARARHIDEYLQSCLDGGLEQLVILGAGLDSRAYRFEGLRGRVRVFEVDHPATQQVKIERLKRRFGSLPDQVVYVPVDFAEETLERRLCDSGYDKRLKTLFIWEGVVYYLTAEAVDGTLAFVARSSGRGSSIIFDYIYAAALDGASKRDEVTSMRRSQVVTGEGLIFGIEEGTIEEFLGRRGFCEIQNASSEDLKRAYFAGPNQNRLLAPVYAIVHATVKPQDEG